MRVVASYIPLCVHCGELRLATREGWQEGDPDYDRYLGVLNRPDVTPSACELRGVVGGATLPEMRAVRAELARVGFRRLIASKPLGGGEFREVYHRLRGSR